MSMFKKGPQLKLSALRVPDFVLDLYYDLRERHLLPLAAILVVAIFAVPILLSQGGSGSLESAGGETAAIPAATASGQQGLLVARSAPGLQDYRRRLARLHAKDPFKQQYEVGSEAPGGASTGPAEGGSDTPTSTPESPTSAPAGEPTETSSEPIPGAGKLTYFSYAVDVRVVAGGSQSGAAQSSSGKATVRHNLPELTMFPSRETPAAIYMGSTKDGKKALMLISSNVKAIFGDGKCVLGSDSCELLAMEPGVPETLVYGGAGKTYKIELLKIHLVTTDKLNRAPLGKPKEKHPGS